MSTEEKEELLVLQDVQEMAVKIFAPNGTDKIVQAIREKVMNVVSDTSTAKGRSEIASRAQKVRKSKVVIENAKKDLTRDLKAQTKAIDAEGKIAKDALDKIIEEVMEPLQAWRDAEAERVVKLKERLNNLSIPIELTQYSATSAEIKASIDKIISVKIDDTWQELKDQAISLKEESYNKLLDLFADADSREKQQAELERLKKEEAERKQKEREEQIAKDAAAKAEAARVKAEADKKAAIAREEATKKQAAIDAEAAEAREKQGIEGAKNRLKAAQAKAAEDQKKAEAKVEADKKQALIDAEEQRQFDLFNAEEDKKAALKKAEDDANAAIEAERLRVANEQAATDKKAAKKAANTKHQGTINNAALKDLIKLGIEEEKAKEIIRAIARNLIANITINY